ncbi:MAG: response regulator transcription factor, partial [Actinomycetia bacterium]|nr:response regulator transcription factor [Actinomycetes bacterium]
EGLEELLSKSDEIKVIALASDGEEAIQVCKDKKPDVVIMDIQMPGIGGIESMKMIKKEFPQCKVLILSAYDLNDFVVEALRGGASGYIMKNIRKDGLIEAIKEANDGNVFIDTKLTKKLLASMFEGRMLTGKEKEVLKLISKGCSNKEIALELHVSPSTIKTHVENIFKKLEVKDRTQAVVEGLKKKIISSD